MIRINDFFKPSASAFINQVVCGDCVEVLRDLPSDSIDLVVTDPPYLVDYRSQDGRHIANDREGSWLLPAFSELFRVLRPDSFCVSFYGATKVDEFMNAWRAVGFEPVGHFAAVKDYASSVGFTEWCHESAYLLAKGEPAKPAHPCPDILPWKYTGNRLHPTQKPVETLTPLIESYSQPGDVVLDPFCGSGSTGAAAKAIGRKFICIEQMDEYATAARKRLQE